METGKQSSEVWYFCLFWNPISVVNSETEKVSPEGAFSPCDNQGCCGAQILQSSRITVSSEMYSAVLKVEQFYRRLANCHIGQRSIFWPTKMWSNTLSKGVKSEPHPLLECLISLCESFCRKMLIRWNWIVLLKCLHFDENSPQAPP